ncbi:HVO_0476 family zinc finger protein [Halobacteriaceae archaeon GCM10025711]
MSEPQERVAVACPSCSPDLDTVHEVLTTGGGHATVRCTECGHVHKESMDEPETTECDVVVSQDGESFTATVDAPADETVAVGEEFILDTDEAIMQVRITSIEVGPEQRVEEATARDVETFWTRAVDNVSVDVTVNPKDGQHDATRSVTLYLPGDHEFVVGETEEFGDEKFTVKGLHLRTDAEGYGFSKLDHRGDAAFAKDLKRVYADDETSAAWSAW